MAKPTPEQLEEFEKWNAEQKGNPATPEALKGVVEDDIKEAEESSKKKETWSREYNHAPAPSEPKIVAEDEDEKS